MKISAHLWKCLNITENFYLNSETVWKSLLAFFIAEWSSTYVVSIFCELNLRNPTPTKIDYQLGQN